MMETKKETDITLKHIENIRNMEKKYAKKHLEELKHSVDFYCCKTDNNEPKCVKQCQFCIDWVEESNEA